MHVDVTPLVVGLLIFLASLISLRFGISVAIIEILLGGVAGAFGLESQAWMVYLARFGGVLLTFLAGTEIDTALMKERFSASFQIGALSFLFPFLGVAAFCRFVANWDLDASLVAGVALSTTSLAVVYSVLIESGLAKTMIGKMLMAATFITDMGTALALSVLFAKPTIFSLVFILASLVIIVFATRYSHLIFGHPRLQNKVIEPEIKYVFVLLLAFMYFATLGDGHAVLPAFVLGLLMSKHFAEGAQGKVLRNRLRTVAYAVITPIFFIVGGLNVSIQLVWVSIGLFSILLLLKLATKFMGVYFLARRHLPGGSMYTTLLMSTGLTFGTISSVYGLNSGIIDKSQYSVLVGVVVASAILPTFVAQRWFLPTHSEDLVEMNGPEKNGSRRSPD
jgi:Kef-type K+ transport system membrane component KefB